MRKKPEVRLTETQRELAIRAAWECGRLIYKLRPHQARAYDLFYSPRDSKKLVICAGRRFGKSVFLLTLCAEKCLREPGVQCAFVAPVEKGLRDYIDPVIQVVFNDCPDNIKPELNSKNHLVFPNGSKIMFNGCNMRQYRFMRGQKLGLAVVDEMSEVDDLESAVDDVLFPAVWDSHGEMVLSGTPPVVPAPDHPVVRYVEAAKMASSYFHGTVYDAGYTEDDIQVAMREVGIDGKDSPRFRREFMAEFIRDDSAVVIPEFIENKHVLEQIRPPYFALLAKCLGCDLGVVDKTTALFGYYDFPTATIQIQAEFSMNGTEVRTDLFAEAIKKTEKDLGWNNEKVTRWSDNSNLILINDLTSIHGLAIFATDKEAKAEMVNKVRILFQQNRIKISPKCRLLIATLNSAFWDKNKKDFGRSKALGHMDMLDALIYLVRNINMYTNPFPADYGYNKTDHVYPANWDRRAHTKDGQMLEKLFSPFQFTRKPNTKPDIIGGL